MVNLFDIVRHAQSGSAMDNLGRQFGLSFDQTQRAMEALLPALSLGFQRSARNPTVFGQLLEMVASGRYAPFFDGTGQAGLAQPNGQQVLEKLFGSNEVTRQIAAQGSAMTGIGTQVLQQMLPGLAAIVMGGLFRHVSVEGLSDVLRNWSDWLRAIAPYTSSYRQPASPSAGAPYEALANLMGAMLGGTPPPPRPAPQAMPADPWTSFMQAFTKNLPPGSTPPPPPPAPSPSQPNPFEALSHMFETGREVQAQHLASLQHILDAFWTGQPQAAAKSERR